MIHFDTIIIKQGICKPFPTFVKLDPSIPDIPLTKKDLEILNPTVQPQRKSNSSQSLGGFLESSGRQVGRIISIFIQN